MATIYDLTTEKMPSTREIGGKARGLMQAIRYGFEVPEGFVLPVSFFDAWFDTIHRYTEWVQYLMEPTPAVCADLQAKVRRLHFSEEQKTALDLFLSDSNRTGLLAVRSSSPEEDQEENSFAGMYRTNLDVDSEDLEQAVASTFASMFDYRVLTYKWKKGFDASEPRMAVIVQRQLESTVSGVGFSLNPEDNCYDEILINAVSGPGDALVDGTVTPDCYLVEKYEKRLLRKGLSANQEDTHLDDEGIQRVADLVRECEETFGSPVDIEWSYEGEALYLLQVRNITTYFPLFKEMMSEPGEPKILYVDVMQTSQGITDPLSVLGLDIYDMAMQRIMAQGIMPSSEGGYLLNLHGKQYFNVSNMLRGMGKNLAIQTVGDQDMVVRQRKEEIWATYTSAGKTPAMRESKKAMAKVAVRDMPRLAGSFVSPMSQLERYKRLTEQMLKDIRELSNEGGFLRTVEEGFNLLAPITEQAATYVPGQLALERIKKIFKGKEMEDEIAALGIALPSNPTTEMTKSLQELAQHSEMARFRDEDDFVKRLEERDLGIPFLKKVEEHLYRYGGRCFKEIDIATERCNDNPTLLYRQLKDFPIDNNALLRAEKKKREAVKKLYQEAAELGREVAFRKNLERYEKLFGLREMPKYLVAMLLGRLHRLALEAGRKWVIEGRLDEENQVFNLTLEQIDLAERNPGLKLRPFIKENLEPYHMMEKVKYWPISFDSRGKIITPIPEIAEGGFKGQSISRGVIRGLAKVLDSPFSKPVLPGEILVTHAVEPSWTVIFLKSSGVVLEVGGMLQHGAIIAREFGIPCVSGIRHATTLIRDGDLIEVDGSSGLVKILDKTEIVGS